MVIVCVSIDRTRWDSIKISTHLNFDSGFNMSSGTEDQRPSHLQIPTDDTKVKVEHHVRGSLFGFRGHERGGTDSMASLPELFA